MDAPEQSPKTTPAPGAKVRFPPPFVPLIALAVGFVLSRWVVALPMPLPDVARYVSGVALLAAGIGLILTAGGLFRATGQDPKPWVESPELIAEGIYRWTRNPMYLGMGVLQAAIGILAADTWMVLLVPVTWLAIYRIAIRHEEAYLDEKFGDAYRAYCADVRRWL